MSRLNPVQRNVVRTKGVWTSLELAALVQAMQMLNKMSGIARQVARFLWHREIDLEEYVNVELDEQEGNVEVFDVGDEVVDGQAGQTGEEEIAMRTEADLWDSTEENDEWNDVGDRQNGDVEVDQEGNVGNDQEEDDQNGYVGDDHGVEVENDQDVEVNNDHDGMECDQDVGNDQEGNVVDDRDEVVLTNQSDLEIDPEYHHLDEATYPAMDIPNEVDCSSRESGLFIDENPACSPQEGEVIPQTDTVVKQEPLAVPPSRRKRRNHIEEPVVPTEPVQVKVEPRSPNQDAAELEGRADEDMLFQAPSPPVLNYSDDYSYDFSSVMTSAPNLFPGWMGNGVDEGGVDLPAPLWDTDFYGIPPELINASQERFSNPMLTPPPESLPYTFPYNSGTEFNSVSLNLSENHGNENAPFFDHGPQNVSVVENHGASQPPPTQDPRRIIRIVLRRIEHNIYEVVRGGGGCAKAKRKIGSRKDAPRKKRKGSETKN